MKQKTQLSPLEYAAKKINNNVGSEPIIDEDPDYELVEGASKDGDLDWDCDFSTETKILILGIGGCGSNIVNHLFVSGKNHDYVDYACVNTDASHLQKMVEVKKKIILGPKLTRGRGAGNKPEIGMQAAEQSKKELEKLVGDYNMVFIVAGMGGGTGSGATPVVAQILEKQRQKQRDNNEQATVVVAMITTPFNYESPKKLKVAAQSIQKIDKLVDCIIKVPNQRVLECYGDLSVMESYNKVNEVLQGSVETISNAIASSSLINADFADVCTIMSKGGDSVIGHSEVFPLDEIEKSIEGAMSNPLLKSNDNITSVEGVLVVFTTGNDCSLNKMQQAMKGISKLYIEETDMVLAHDVDNNFDGEVRVSLILTGIKKTSTNEDKKNNLNLDIKANNNKTNKHKEIKHSWAEAKDVVVSSIYKAN